MDLFWLFYSILCLYIPTGNWYNNVTSQDYHSHQVSIWNLLFEFISPSTVQFASNLFYRMRTDSAHAVKYFRSHKNQTRKQEKSPKF